MKRIAPNSKVFLSYTLRDSGIDKMALKKIKEKIEYERECQVYVDILENDLNGSGYQERVVSELIQADTLLLIESPSIMESDWVKREIKIAKENGLKKISIDINEALSWIK